MKPNILFLDSPVDYAKSKLLELCKETKSYSDADIIYTHMTKIDDVRPCLKVVICPCTGTSHLDNIPTHIEIIYLDDKEYLKKFVHSTAEYTIHQILDLMRKNKDELYYTRIGLIGGGGRLGQQVCEKLYGLTKYLPLVYDHGINLPLKHCIEVPTLPSLYEQCDLISIHMNETPWNLNFIDDEQFQLMEKYDVKYLINSSRSSVIDPVPLVNNLYRFKGIVLDVIEGYPDYVKSALRNLAEGNLTLTPHIAGSMTPSRIQTDTYVLNKFEKWAAENWDFDTVTICFDGEPYGELPQSELDKIIDDIKSRIRGVR